MRIESTVPMERTLFRDEVGVKAGKCGEWEELQGRGLTPCMIT